MQIFGTNVRIENLQIISIGGRICTSAKVYKQQDDGSYLFYGEHMVEGRVKRASTFCRKIEAEGY